MPHWNAGDLRAQLDMYEQHTIETFGASGAGGDWHPYAALRRAAHIAGVTDPDFYADLHRTALLAGVTDWGFYPEDPGSPLVASGGGWCFWWDDECQSRFAEIWGPDADQVADGLADRFGFGWPWLAGTALPTRAPTTQARIEAFAADEALVARTNGTNPRTILGLSTVWGSFRVLRARRSWFVPTEAVCAVCGHRFWTGEVPVWTYTRFGVGRYCEDCCLRVRTGVQGNWRRPEAVTALRELAEAFGAIPKQAYAFEFLPLDAALERRDRCMRALCAMPDVRTLKYALGVSDWLGALQAAGLVGEARRTSRGTWCRADDGHLCRSLIEKSIDDWMARRGLAHEREPHWPAHPTLNSNGRKRADWLLPSGAYVECVGMMEDPDYAEKVRLKQLLAADLGLRIYLVGPTDLYALDQVFVDELLNLGTARETDASGTTRK